MILESIEQVHEKGIKLRKQAEDLLLMLKERALIEEFYAKDLERLANKLPAFENPSITEFFKKTILIVSNQALGFSHSLSNGIIDKFKELLIAQANHIKDFYLEGIKNEKRKNRLGKKLDEAKIQYWKCCEDCEKVAVSLDSETSPNKKEKLLSKLIMNKNTLDYFYKSYLEKIDLYNKYKKTYLTKAKKIISVFNSQETQLFEAFYNTEKEILELQGSFLKSIVLPSLDSLTSVSDDISKLLVYSEGYFEAYEGSHPLFKNLGINSAPHLHASILEVSGVDKGTQTAVEDMYRTEVGNIVFKAWNGKDLTSEEYLHFNAMLKEHLGRKAWTWCMNSKRTQGIFTLEEKGFFQVSELMIAALNECERAQDIIIAKNCIILSQTFYKIFEGTKDYLQNYILNHTLWENIEFWEKVIISAITEELKNQGDGEILSEHLKSLVFCQLVSFGHIMMSFKINERIIEVLIQKIGKNYELSEDEGKEIMVMFT